MKAAVYAQTPPKKVMYLYVANKTFRKTKYNIFMLHFFTFILTALYKTILKGKKEVDPFHQKMDLITVSDLKELSKAKFSLLRKTNTCINIYFIYKKSLNLQRHSLTQLCRARN